MATANACGNRLFKVDVSQAVEESAVFNHTKKCFQRSGNFRRKTCIFCAAVNLLKSQVLIKRTVIGRKRA